MRKAYKFRIYPNKEQRQILERTLNTCRILYNNLLAERRNIYKKTGRSPSYYEQKRSLAERKTNNPYLRQTVKVAKVHRKVRLQRMDFNHKLSRMLVNRFGVIVFERLLIQNMVKNHSLAKGITDAGWGQLQAFTSYKAAEAGAVVKFVDPYGTTADCSRCGFHVPKTLSERIHKCPNCGLVRDRDWNAAVNVLNRVGWGTAESTPAEAKPLLQPRPEGASEAHEPGSPRP